MESVNLNVNVAKFTQAQIENLVKKKSLYESRNKLIKQENAELKDKLKYALDPLESIFQLDKALLKAHEEVSYWKEEAERAKKKHEQKTM